MKPISSAITGLPHQAETQPSLTGAQRGATESETRPNTVVSVQPDRLVARTPKVNLEAAVSSLRDCGISVRHEVTGSRFPKSGGWEPIMSLSVQATGEVNTEMATRIVNGLMAPANDQTILEWLTICAALTVDKKEAAASSEVRLHAYVTKLRQYPGDVVRKTLDDWPDRSKWFPAWEDLAKTMNVEMGIRASVVERVRALVRSAQS